MPHRFEERDGLHVILVSGEIPAAEAREQFRAVAELLHPGPVFILIAYEQGCRYLPGPRETLQLQLSVAESLGDSEGSAMAFVCPEDEIYGICRQFQMLLPESRIRMAVLREGFQAVEWLTDARLEGASDPAWQY